MGAQFYENKLNFLSKLTNILIFKFILIKFAFEGRVREADFALSIIEQTHQQWKDLVNKQVGPREITR